MNNDNGRPCGFTGLDTHEALSADGAPAGLPPRADAQRRDLANGLEELSRLYKQLAAHVPPDAPVRDLGELSLLAARHADAELPLDLAVRLLRVLKAVAAFLIPLKLGVVVDSAWPEDGEASDA